MTLKTQMAADMAVFYNTDDYAEEITYTPTGGDAVTITAIVTRDADNQDAYVRGPETATALLQVQISDVTNPVHGDTFTGGLLGADTWGLDPEKGVLEKTANDYVLLVRRVES